MKAGRNDPCPCGSGKKHKKCCGRNRTDADSAQIAHRKASTHRHQDVPPPQSATASEMNELVELLNSGRCVELEYKARELLVARPDAGFLWKALGISLAVQGKDALQALQNAARLLPDDAEAHSNLGATLLGLGHLHEAAASCRRAIAIEPQFAMAYNNLGNTLRRLGQGDEALAMYHRALQIEPQFTEAHNNLGNALRSLGREDEAVASYRRALTLKPHFAEAHNNLANALRSLGRVDEAVTSYRHALDLQPQSAQAHSNLGNALLDLGQIEAAAQSYRRALALQPDYADAHNNLGNALRALGNLNEAAASCRRALDLRVDFAEGHSNLGNALRELGQLDDAVASYRRALQLKPRYAEAHSNLGNALRDVGQLDEAVASYRRALELKPEYAEAHSKLGNALFDLWQLENAAANCRRALQIKPDLAEAHNYLGNALLDLGQIDEAEASYRRALALKENYAEAHNNLSCTLRLQGRAAEAEASCRRALQLNPELAAAHALLGELHSDQGQFAKAEDLLLRAAALEPKSAAPWAAIASLRKMTSSDTAWLEQAQRIAAQGSAPRQEVLLRYAIGKYFNDLGEFDQAFKSYERANELTRLHRPKHDRLQVTQTVDQIIRSYDGKWLQETRIDSPTAPRAVFIVGMPRSGTTLAEQILASHAQVFGAGELPFWNCAPVTDDAAELSGKISGSTVRTLGHDYLELLNCLSVDALRVVDKMPDNFMSLGLIHAAVPGAKIIHMRRHPIDTCLSIYFQNFNTTHTYANDLEDLAHYYAEYLRIMKHWQSILPQEAILEVSYEGLVHDPEGWSRKILEFIDLPWDPQCMDFDRTQRTVITASKWQVRQKINNSSIERWRSYHNYLGPLLSLA
jgi:tetratricopeptide (TPR) repeat protein